MSIASRITEMETHIGNAYTSINNLGIDISNTNKNIYNISTLLDTFYESLPKVSGIGASLSLSPSMVGKIKLNEIQGDTLQNGTPTPSSPVPIQSVTGLQNIEICGNNLLDLSKCINGYINASGEIGTGNNNLLSDYIKVESGKSYTISLNTQFQNIGYALFDNNKTYISRQNNNNKTTLTIVIPSGTNYIRVWFTLNGVTVLTPTNILQYEPMIEQGSATSYEPYKGNNYEVNLGKNLFDYTKISYIANGTHNNGVITQTGQNCYFYFDNIPVYNGETIYFSADIKLNSSSTGTFSNINDNVNGGTTKILQPTLSTTYQRYQTSFKYTSDTTINKMLVQITNFSGSAEITNIMISKSSNPKYTPYFTPIELNKIGDYKDSIKKSTGKNLCNGINQEVFLNTAVDKCGIITGNTGLYIKVNGGIYTISTTTTQTRYRVACAINEPSETQQNVYNGVNKDNTRNSITIDTTGYNYLIVNATNLDNIMINEGSTALPYEPYGKVWYVKEDIGKVVLNGSESDSTYNTGTTGSFTRFGYLPFMSTDVCKIQSDYVSNYFKYLGAIGGDTTEAGISNTSVSGLNRLFIFLPTSTASTIAQFKTWLTTHNTEIKYIMATPKYTVITNTELIEQLESLYNAKSEDGTTNINVTSEDLSMILNVSVLKGE